MRTRPAARLLVALTTLLAVCPAVGADFVVDRTQDGAGPCVPNDCTLRAAIESANASPGPDRITFSVPPGSVFPLVVGALDVTGDLDIVGPAPQAQESFIVVDGGRRDRVFCLGCLSTGAPPPNVRISHVTIANGLNFLEGGGGIFNAGNLTLEESVVMGNVSNLGGGILNFPASAMLTMSNCQVLDNDASDAGGGLRNDGTATLTDTQILDNRASRDGGGIANAGTLTMTRGTIQGNDAIPRADPPGDGGGLSNEAGGTATLRHVFVKLNSAENRGGGIFNAGSLDLLDSAIKLNTSVAPGGGVMNAGTLRVVNSTISTNSTATSGGGLATMGTATLNNVTVVFNGSPDHGGGLAQLLGAVTLSNTIVASNTSPSAPDCTGTLTSGGYNLIEDPSACTVTGDLTGNLTGVAPHLDRADANAGITPMHALLAGSPAINAGNPAASGACAAADQRGVLRPQGGRCDIGAYESHCGDGVRDGLPDRTQEECDAGSGPSACCTATCTLVPGCGTTTTTTTTTAASLPATTSTTSPAAVCSSIVECDDGDRCTLDSCLGGQCVSRIRFGFEGADCRLRQVLDPSVCAPESVGTRLAKTVRNRVRRVERLLEASPGVGSRKARKLILRAGAQLHALRVKVDRSRDTSPACRQRLVALLVGSRSLVEDLAP